MEYRLQHFMVWCMLFLSCESQQGKEVGIDQTVDLIKYVDPFIGTGYHGHTLPGPALPFGQIQLSPDNGRTS